MNKMVMEAVAWFPLNGQGCYVTKVGLVRDLSPTFLRRVGVPRPFEDFATASQYPGYLLGHCHL
jgi:hypothetical protein